MSLTDLSAPTPPADVSTTVPTVFVSHGSPMLLFSQDAPSYDPLQFWPDQLDLESPALGLRGVLVVSAHWQTDVPTFSATRDPDTLHDFQGFPSGCYDLFYAADGAPDIAAEASAALKAAGLPVAETIDMERGLDQGSWIPLMMAFPAGDVPVAVLSVQPGRSLADHLALGRALAPLRERGVLILGSGGSVHNLDHWAFEAAAVEPWAHRFDEALTETVSQGSGADVMALLDSDDGRLSHPTPDHVLPLMVVLGAAGDRATCQILHRGVEDGCMGMSAYAFS